MASRTEGPIGSLARFGFLDPDRAAQQLERLGEVVRPLAPLLGRSADPDQALDGLVALAEAADDREQLLAEVADDEGTSMRLLSVLGGSRALGDHLRRHPGHWRELCDPTLGSTRPSRAAMLGWLLEAVGATGERDPVVTGDPDEACDALRVEYRRQLLRIAARDLAHGLGVDDVAAELSDLAAGTLEAALAIARARHPDAAAQCRLAVIAMGKCGGHELNYVSDVDVVFVAEPVGEVEEHVALRAATQLASTMMRTCGDQTREGTIWPVDANLRPEGRSGPLVRTLASHQGYYERWAKTWEFQALLKARPVAGDLALGEDYAAMVTPLVWSAVERSGFVEEVQAMRRRVVAHIPAGESERQLKLGPGGLRDVEFAVQLLQMVHGRTDETIRPPTTLSALARLTERGYVGRDDGSSLHEAYVFLRTMEHRLQLAQLRRTHVVPADEDSLHRLGRSLGFQRDPVAELDKQWHFHQREVRRLHEKLFYRPLLSAVARISSDEARLSPEAAKERLSALGYLDPTAALRHLEALTSGMRRSAQIQRQLLPAMLGWFADAPDPDAGLFGFRQLSEALGSTPWYLRVLRDEGEVAQRMAQVLATSRYATGLLRREPQGVALLAEQQLAPLPRESVLAELRAAAARRDDVADAVAAVRAVRRRELLRISVADLCVPFGVEDVGYALSDLAAATLETTLERVVRAVAEARGIAPPTRLAVIAMGRFGGHELGYGSDADVMFVHDPEPGADAQEAADFAKAVVNDLRRLLGDAGKDPALEVDVDLRPEGRQGPMVRTLESYAAYYGTWSAVWEAQALLRAKPIAGDADLLERFTAMIDPLRFAADGLSADDTVEIRRIKARVDAERLPRGADPATHFKLGRGGLADVEWTVQLLQMQHAGHIEALRTTKTLEALEAAVAHDLLAREDAEGLATAWRFASRARNATVQVRGKASDQLPRDARERAAVAAVLQYPPDDTEAMVNDYLRSARRARTIVDRIFWGDRA